MPRQNKNSPAFETWVTDFLGARFQDEGCYDKAVLAAELLEHRREVSSAELVEMVRRANAMLARLPGHELGD
ncbi:hypothetical protein RTH46_08960 [Pseudomonas sp. zfem004]|uniref:hypothetical protein n=1 Tax=Pseudomonas sp. zfem004 TaxID=3078199 RepID=UPI002928875E|nr:hypothetical protein [Pseudomonas sp. zfem004]MDU9402620.1 hypothetical protein [Pseudomonas sp. zfem004]